MINWIIGGVIVGLTVLIIVRTILKVLKGKSCCCEGCSQTQCSSRRSK